MKFLFWAGLVLEILALGWFLYQIWLVSSGRSGYIEAAYPDLYRKNGFPAAVLFLIVSSALVARYGFDAPKVATWIVLSPALLFVLAMVGMVVASMFIRDWR